MDASFPGYSAAQALRVGGASTVRDALQAARARTLAHADAYAQALAPAGMRIAYDTGLNPPLWELGHIAWFQEYWIARNRQRAAGVLCDPDHERAPPLLAPADSWYDSSRVAHRLRWELDLPSAQGVRGYLAQTLEQTLELLDGMVQFRREVNVCGLKHQHHIARLIVMPPWRVQGHLAPQHPSDLITQPMLQRGTTDTVDLESMVSSP